MMARTIARITAFSILTAVTAGALSSCYDPRVTDFYNECESLGGEVQQTVPPGIFDGGRIDCIVDNKIVYLKGYN